MNALRTRVLLALVAAGALSTASCAQEPRVPVPTVTPPTTLVETLSPIPNTTTGPPPPPVVMLPETPVEPEPTPEWVPETYVEPERVLQYCEDGTGIYSMDDYTVNDPACYQYQDGPGTSGGQVWTDQDGTWVYICSGPEDPRPEAECTIPAN